MQVHCHRTSASKGPAASGAALACSRPLMRSVRHMRITPHHLAAAQYSVLAIFLWASWWVLLSPLEGAMDYLKFIFAPSYEHRTFFVFFSLSVIVSTALAVSFWFSRSSIKPFSSWLAVVACIFLAISIWFLNSSVILGSVLGCACARWSYFMPKTNKVRSCEATI